MSGTGEVATATDQPSGPDPADDLGLRPLTARSVMASVLLGTHPPNLPVRSLVRVGDLFGIAEGTTRVALSRMVADGDLTATDGHYELGPRLLGRQAALDRGLRPATVAWDGSWEIVILTGEPPGIDRDATAAALRALGLASLAGGTWLRPANLVRLPDQAWPPSCRRFESRAGPGPDAEDVALARSLWDIDRWSRRGEGLLAAFAGGSTPADRFVAAAAILRHLRTDPLLPAVLTGERWPAARLRATYAEFDTELAGILAASRDDGR